MRGGGFDFFRLIETILGVTRTHIAVAISFLAGGLAIGYFIGRKYSMASHVTKLNLGCINMDCDKV
jgi:hypothetical protein